MSTKTAKASDDSNKPDPPDASMGEKSAKQESKSSSNSPKKRTHWWFVLVGVAVAVLMVGLFAPGAIRNYCVHQAEASLLDRHYDEALKWLGRAEGIAPNDGEVAFLQARAHRKSGDFDEYEKSMARARKLNYSRDRCRREEWLKEAQSGKMVDAEKHLVELLDDKYSDSAEVAEAFTNGYLLTGRLNEARRFLQSWEADYPDDPQPKLMNGLIYQMYGQREEAVDYFREALKLQPDFYPAMLALADTLNVLREFDEAISLYEQASESDTHRLDALSKLGLCLRRRGNEGDLQRAKEVLLKAHELDENHVHTLAELGRVEVMLQEYDNAVVHLESALENDSSEPDIFGIYAMALRGVGRVDEAAEYSEYSQEASRMLALAGDLSRDLGEDSENLDVRVRVGRIILKYGKEQEGLIWLFSTLNINTEFAPAHAALAEFYLNKSVEDPRFEDRAQAHLQKAAGYQLGPLE